MRGSSGHSPQLPWLSAAFVENPRNVSVLLFDAHIHVCIYIAHKVSDYLLIKLRVFF
jgi:hypothetical protein